VRFSDLAAQHRPLEDELARAVRETLATGQLILGPEVERFERAVAATLGGRHAVGVSSGTDALLVALLALGVGPNDEVVTTPFSFFATVESIVRVGARPVFADIEPGTLNLDPVSTEAVIGDRTRAVVPVHLFGTPARLDALTQIAARRGLSVVEDAAQAFGSRYRGRSAGTWGACGCFSFFPAKLLGAAGDAGLVITDDDALAERCLRLRQHGAVRRGEHVDIGGNFRMDAVQAAVLSVKLAHVERWTQRRRAIAAAYDAAFRQLAGLRQIERGDGWNGSIYTVRVLEGRRDALRGHLADRGIETAVYYERPLHLQPALGFLGLGPGSLPESERAAVEVLSLPLYAELSDAARDHVAESVCTFFG
jgi:dTDP-4-amino-4,6-dideoxygalactose transaminase